jgi:hypothetical protein
LLSSGASVILFSANFKSLQARLSIAQPTCTRQPLVRDRATPNLQSALYKHRELPFLRSRVQRVCAPRRFVRVSCSKIDSHTSATVAGKLHYSSGCHGASPLGAQKSISHEYSTMTRRVGIIAGKPAVRSMAAELTWQPALVCTIIRAGRAVRVPWATSHIPQSGYRGHSIAVAVEGQQDRKSSRARASAPALALVALRSELATALMARAALRLQNIHRSHKQPPSCRRMSQPSLDDCRAQHPLPPLPGLQ